MPIIEWNERFLLGINQFDEHHQHLVKLLNNVYDDFISGVPAGHIGIILDELIDYATYHFAAEEYWMKENLYPGLIEHSHEHDKFSSNVVEMMKDFHSGNLNLSIDVLTFLKTWLKNHILVSDADYSNFVTAPNKDSSC